jgi:hypothetical protein
MYLFTMVVLMVIAHLRRGLFQNKLGGSATCRPDNDTAGTDITHAIEIDNKETNIGNEYDESDQQNEWNSENQHDVDKDESSVPTEPYYGVLKRSLDNVSLSGDDENDATTGIETNLTHPPILERRATSDVDLHWWSILDESNELLLTQPNIHLTTSKLSQPIHHTATSLSPIQKAQMYPNRNVNLEECFVADTGPDQCSGAFDTFIQPMVRTTTRVDNHNPDVTKTCTVAPNCFTDQMNFEIEN